MASRAIPYAKKKLCIPAKANKSETKNKISAPSHLSLFFICLLFFSFYFLESAKAPSHPYSKALCTI